MMSKALYFKEECDKLIHNSEDAIRVFKEAREKRTLSINFTGYQSFDSMRRFPSGSVVPLDGNINVLLHHGENTISWLTVIPAGNGFSSHWHDCAETCIIVYGELLEKTTGRIYKAGEVVSYDRLKKHEPVNPSVSKDLKIHVTFTKK